jgi:molybdopterin-guanine dinucleotide biosynthesis protein A
VEVVVLAGGSGARFGHDAAGRDKVDLLLGVTLAGLPAWLPAPWVAGPERAAAPAPGLRWCREEPPGGGPVAGLAAALAGVRAPRVLVLAADMPRVGRAVPTLLAALEADPGADVAVLVDATGRAQPLATAWRSAALRAALGSLGPPAGAPARGLLAGRAVVEVPDTWGAALDVDTPADLARVKDVAMSNPLQDWVDALAARLGVTQTPDIHQVLDLARDAAAAVERPAAPLTAFLVGYAAAQSGGGRAAIDDAVARARELAEQWPAPGDAPAGPTG